MNIDFITHYNIAVSKLQHSFTLFPTRMNLALLPFLTSSGFLLGYEKRRTLLCVYPRYVEGKPIVSYIKRISVLPKRPNGLVLYTHCDVGLSWDGGIPLCLLMNT